MDDIEEEEDEEDWPSQVRATSAASSLALLTFLPSYQKRALWTWL